MKKSLKTRLTLLGLSYQKEVAILLLIPVIFSLGGFAIYFFFKEIIAGVGIALAGLVLDYLYFSRYSKLEKEMEREHINEFISLMSYFEAFISNGNNVYNSFKMLIPYSSPYMDDVINSLLIQIDMDKSVGPYITFASKFNSHVIESLMLSIYQMIDSGESTNQFTEFEFLFSNIKNSYSESLVEEKKKSLDSLNSFPLIGAGFLTITLSICIVSLIGGYINVL